MNGAKRLSPEQIREAVAHLDRLADNESYAYGSTWRRTLSLWGSDLASSEDAIAALVGHIAALEVEQ